MLKISLQRYMFPKPASIELITIFYLSAVAIICLVYTNIVIDYTLTPRYVMLSVCLLLLLGTMLFIKSKRGLIRLDSLLLPFLGFTLFSVVSVFWASNTALSLTEGAKMVLFFVFTLITTSLFRANGDSFLGALIKVSFLVFLVVFIFIINQITDLPEYGRSQLYGISGINGHKNLLSGFLYLSSIFSLIGLIHFKKLWRFISLGFVIVQLVLVIFLQTRAVWTGYFVFIFSIAIIYMLKDELVFVKLQDVLKVILTLMIILNVSILFTLPQFLTLYQNRKADANNIEQLTDATTFAERTLVWQKTYTVFRESKWFGVGGNNWQIFFPKGSLPEIYRLTDLNVTFQRPHNDFLWILSEYGLFGFNMYYLFIFSIFCFLFYSNLPVKKSINFILAAGILGYLAISFFDFPRERIEHNILFYLLVGIAISQIRKQNISLPVFKLPAYIILLIAMMLSGIFYHSIMSFRGEFFLKKMYVSRFEGNHTGVINYGNKAKSYYYNIDPTSIPISWYIGNAYARNREYSDALNSFKEAYTVHPYSQHVLSDLGSAFNVQQLYDSAKIYYLKATEINPRYENPIFNLALIYYKEDNLEEAEKWNESLPQESRRREQLRELINLRKKDMHDNNGG